MNRALLQKTTRDSLVLIILVMFGILLLESMFVAAMREFMGEIEYLLLNKEIFQRFARMMLGADLGGEISATGLMTIGFAHPLLLAMSWALLLTVCTGAIVGEIHRGTADLLLSLPVSRTRIYSSVSLVWAAAGVPLMGAALLGAYIGESLAPLPEPINFVALTRLAVNLLALYWCIGCATMCVSSFCTRRGLAVAVVLCWLLGSMLLNFLSQFWSLAKSLSFIGVMRYYKPLPTVREGTWPVGDLLVLLVAGTVLWLVGLWQFRRRDIPAV